MQEQAASEHERDMLLDCLNGGHLRLALQPIVSGKDTSIEAFECLLRSTHSVLDGPLSVIRAAERHQMLPSWAAVSRYAAGWMGRFRHQAVMNSPG